MFSSMYGEFVHSNGYMMVTTNNYSQQKIVFRQWNK